MLLLHSLLVVLVGLAGRAVMDKALAIKGGAVLVAAWAQLASLGDLVISISLAGIGVALIARLAGCPAEQRLAWVRAALRWCLWLSAAATVIGVPLMVMYGRVVIPAGQEGLAVAALVAGWCGVAPGLGGLALVGSGRPGWAAALIGCSFLPPLLLLILSPFASPLANLLCGQIVFGTATLAVMLRLRADVPVPPDELHSLLRFVPAGIAIGLLSPSAAILGRTRIGEVLSWDHAGIAQAIWRTNEWIVCVTGGLLNVYFLPQLGATKDRVAFVAVLRRAAWQTLVPAGVLMALLWLLLPEAVALLYRPDIVPARSDALPFLLGDWLRAAAWVPLMGLYALHIPRAVTIGEFLSQPLFAALLWSLALPVSLMDIGWAWTGAYFVYAIYNSLALREAIAGRRQQEMQAHQATH